MNVFEIYVPQNRKENHHFDAKTRTTVTKTCANFVQNASKPLTQWG